MPRSRRKILATRETAMQLRMDDPRLTDPEREVLHKLVHAGYVRPNAYPVTAASSRALGLTPTCLLALMRASQDISRQPRLPCIILTILTGASPPFPFPEGQYGDFTFELGVHLVK